MNEERPKAKIVKIQNIVAVVWTRTNKQTNVTKNNYVKMWVVMTNDQWMQTIKLETIPVWFTWWATIYDQKEDNTKLGNPDQDIPFE